MSVLELGTLNAEPGALPEVTEWTSPQLSALLLERLAPWLTAATDPTGDHATYLTALAAMGQQIFSLVWDNGDPDDSGYVPGYGALTDVDLCPTMFLPWLAQLVGVTIPAGTSDTAARSMIRSEQGMQRGTTTAIVAAAQRFLTVSQTCVLLERVNTLGAVDAYHFVLVVRPEEVTDEAALVTAVNAVKPGGVQWDLVQTAGWTISQMEADYATLTALESAFLTVNALEEDQPE